MSDYNSYEEECQRAELLGLSPPDKAEFERKRSERLELELADREAAEAAMLEQQDETLRSTGGKLEELNSILSSTQQRLNRFKQTACGSLTNIFSRGGSLSGASGMTGPMDVTSAADESAEQVCQRQPMPMAPPTAAQVSAAKAAKQLKMDNQLDKLDSLINSADNAQIAMSEQTKQMRHMAK